MKFIVAFAIIFLVSHCSCENKFIQLEYSNIFANCSTRIFNNLLFLFSSGKFEIILFKNKAQCIVDENVGNDTATDCGTLLNSCATISKCLQQLQTYCPTSAVSVIIKSNITATNGNLSNIFISKINHKFN